MATKILLTGVTGALGPEVAAQLLGSGCTSIGALIRPTTRSPHERFQDWRKWVGHLPAAAGTPWASALELVSGDVSLPDVGLDRQQSQALAQQTQVIVHAAADTRFRGPADEQWNVNVEGTRRLLDWAARCPRLRRFLLVSTTCVAGSATGSIPEAFATPPRFVNYYEQTKWEAERLVLASKLPVSIARVSIVSGSHATGEVHRLGAFHHALRWFGRGLIPQVPGTLDSTVDLIAAETAARCIAKAVAQADDLPPIWQIAAGDAAVPLPELMRFVWDHYARRAGEVADASPSLVDCSAVIGMRTPSSVDHDTNADAGPCLAHAPADGARRHRVSERLRDCIDSFLPGLLLYPKMFQTTEAQRIWGGPLPLPDWRETLARVLNYLESERFTARPSARTQQRSAPPFNTSPGNLFPGIPAGRSTEKHNPGSKLPWASLSI
jgi:nucleoside-diphosphate-sugar epimerase